MEKYFHSVRLDTEKCRGCTNCIKRCPTDAIRVQQGKARILNGRCIDCGECIRVCPYHAKIAYTDSLINISNYKYRIALPAPAIYGQLKKIDNPEQIYSALRMLGFDEVFDVAKGADIVTGAVRRRIRESDRFPLISSACPAVIRLIQVRFPELIENIVDVESPMEVAASIAKDEFAKKNNIKREEIGVFFITPCPAKVTAIKAPLTRKQSNVDGAISILEIYGLLTNQIKHNMANIQREDESISMFGLGWANSGGECRALGDVKHLAVDGVHNVIRVLEEIENDKLNDLEFFEGLACNGGCVGGPLAFENSYVARSRIDTLCESIIRVTLSEEKINGYIEQGVTQSEQAVEPLEVLKLDDDFMKAMHMMEEIEKIQERLPGLDCGSCGAPSCRSLAEDIVRGKANEMDCIFLLRDKVRYLADEMETLLKKL